MADQLSWNLDEEKASFTTKDFSASVSYRFPHQGLLNIEFHGQPIEAEILSVSPEPPAPVAGETLIDKYARGTDLVLTYAQTPARSIRPQLYWRILEDVAGVELVMAIQTSLLESNPTMRALTRFAGKDVEVLVPDSEMRFSEVQVSTKPSKVTQCGMFLIRPLGADYSYAELVIPADFHGADVGDEDGVFLRYELIPEFLEKGVIRKARIRGIFLPREGDEQLAASAYAEFAAAAPPLTT